MARAEPQPTGTRATTTPDISVSVVLPAFNEAGALPVLLADVRRVCRDLDRGACEVIVVDDGSTDETAAVIREQAQRHDIVRGVELQANYGQSAALAAGLDHARGDVVVTMDADGQNDPSDIPRLLERYDGGADVVSGWRRDRSDPLGKRVPSRIQTYLAKRTGPDIHDFGCTLTAYDGDAITELDLRGERHRYIPALLHHRGYDIDEIEVDHHPREHGKSHYGAGRLVRGSMDLLYQLFRVRYRESPMHIFGATGTVVLGIGLTLGLWLTVQRLVFGMGLLPRLPALLLAISLSLFGGGLIALGVVTELLTEAIQQHEQPYRIAEEVE
jgi:glycosyltransferase involved in cell wall biosynthesis